MASIYVLTGGPCAGKSTLLTALAARGCLVVAESAAEVILEGRLHPSRDPLAFQREVLRRQIILETSAPPGLLFVDRGVGDHFGYLEHFRARRGLDLLSGPFGEELLREWGSAVRRYAAVFVLDQAPSFIDAPYRRETEEEARAIHRAIRAAYLERHPRVIEVPWAPLPERVEAVLAAAAQGPPSPISDREERKRASAES